MKQLCVQLNCKINTDAEIHAAELLWWTFTFTFLQITLKRGNIHESLFFTCTINTKLIYEAQKLPISDKINQIFIVVSRFSKCDKKHFFKR